MNLILIGLGGALGAISRYIMSAWVTTWWLKSFPLATLLVNVLGSFLMGVAFVVVVDRLEMLPQARLIFMVGFLGGFTTFSSFSLEAYQPCRGRGGTEWRVLRLPVQAYLGEDRPLRSVGATAPVGEQGQLPDPYREGGEVGCPRYRRSLHSGLQ